MFVAIQSQVVRIVKRGFVLKRGFSKITLTSVNCLIVLHVLVGRYSKGAFTLVGVRVPSAGFGLQLIQGTPARVSVHGHLYKDNSVHVYRQSPIKSNRENALRKSNNIPLHR